MLFFETLVIEDSSNLIGQESLIYNLWSRVSSDMFVSENKKLYGLSF